MYLLLVHSNSIVVATSRQHTPVHHIAMCCINAHAGVRLTDPVLYSVGVYTDTPTTCMPSDQNNCRLATYTLHVMHHAQHYGYQIDLSPFWPTWLLHQLTYIRLEHVCIPIYTYK